MQPQPLIDFLTLDTLRFRLAEILQAPAEDVASAIGASLELLQRFKFNQQHYSLRLIQVDIDMLLYNHPDEVGKPLPVAFQHRITSVMDAIDQRIDLEIAPKRVIVVDENVVTSKLRDLQQTLTGEEKLIILDDTLRCLEAGAYRAAIVMGWNLVYEHLRRWIYKSSRKRLKAFNTVLITKHVSKNQTYDPIKIYEDFHDISERRVVDYAYEADLFLKQKHQVLINALTDRNHFAHPTSRKSTAFSAIGYIENLITNILDDEHFAYKG